MNTNTRSTQIRKELVVPPLSNFVLACLGDLMIGDQTLAALAPNGIQAKADQIWKPLEGADIVVANLEAPVTNRSLARENKRYNLKTGSEILDLFDSRFVLGLANNHMLDYGERGLLDTIEALDSQNILHAGAGCNLEQARRPAVVNVAGVVIGVVCAADLRFQPATYSSAGTFPAHPDLLRKTIREVRQSVDVVVVSIHAGTEFLPVPSPIQLRIAEVCLEEGARVVNFHHAHCVSGVLQHEHGVVFFGTGNYLFPYTIPRGFRQWRESAAWTVRLSNLGQEHRVEIQPIILDGNGLPAKATQKQSRRILRSIQKYSCRIRRRKHLSLWRVCEMIKPAYVWLSIVHYTDICRRSGIRSLLKTLTEAAKSQLGNNLC